MNGSSVTALFLVLMLISPSLNESSNEIHDGLYDYEEEDYNSADYDYLFDKTKTEIKPIIIKSISTTTTPQSQIETANRIPTFMITNQDAIHSPNVHLELFPQKSYQCPESCSCSVQFTQINCSSSNLKNVPSNIPEIIEKLDLSHNEIFQLNPGDFVRYSNLFELILDNNRLTDIDFKKTAGLGKLKYLSLVENQISQIDSNAFSTLSQLKTLNLSKNLIAIGNEKTPDELSLFLNHPSLEELNLSSCKVQKINMDAFRGLNALTTLNLDGNEFDEQIDVHVFDSMKNLVNLKLPNMKRATITELCKVLTAIDTISFPYFDISCFELVSGSTFDESTIRTSELTADVNSIYGTVNSENKPSEGNLKSYTSKDESQGTVEKNSEKSIKIEQEDKKKQSSVIMKESGTSSSNGTTPAINQHQADSDDEEEYKVAISTQTINHILIGIIIVAATGIIIGIICRRDICGIKTKMCRTRRPPPMDQVQPAEEIPLNKV